MLTAHPQVFMARKELHFFGKDLGYHRVPMSRDRYQEHFAHQPATTLRAGDASAWTLFSDSAPSEIARFAPDARIVVALRSPAEMIHSIHGLLFHGCQEDIADFDRAVGHEEVRVAGRDIPEASRPKMALHYTRLGRYHTHLRRWLDQFGRDRMHIILLDDLKADPAREGQRLADFLALSSPLRPTASSQARNSHRATKSRRVQRWTQRQVNRAMLDGVVPFSPHRRVALGLIQRLNTRFSDRTEMAPHTRAHICDTLGPEIEALGALLDRDLSHWTRP